MILSFLRFKIYIYTYFFFQRARGQHGSYKYLLNLNYFTFFLTFYSSGLLITPSDFNIGSFYTIILITFYGLSFEFILLF